MLPMPAPSLCVAAALEACDLHIDDFISPRKHVRLIRCRQIAAWLIRTRTLASTVDAAKAIGRSNHSTICTIHRRVEELIQTQDPSFQADFAAAEQRLNEMLQHKLEASTCSS